MPYSNKISVRAFMIVSLFFTVGTSILIAPAGLAMYAKQDAWMSAILGSAIDVSLAWLYAILADKHPGQTLVQLCSSLLGRWAGGLAGLLFTGFCYFLASLLVADMGYFLSTQIMPETPIEIVMSLFVLLVALTAKEGMQTYSRATEIFFPWFCLLLGVLVIPLFVKFNIDTLRPPLEFGPLPILKGSFSFYSLQEVVVLLMLYPYVAGGGKRRRAYLLGTAAGGLVLVMITSGCLFVLGVELTSNKLYPAYDLAKNIGLGRMLQRIEGVMMFIWILTIFFKTVISFHASVIGMNQIFGIRDDKLLAWPMALGLIPLGLASYTNIVEVSHALSKAWGYFASLFMVVLPLLLLGLSLLRPSRRRRQTSV